VPVPIAVTEEQRAIQESIRQWAAGAGVLATVRSLEPGRPAGHGQHPAGQHWADLAGLGLFALGLPDQDGSVADLAAAVEQVAAALVPGPVLPTVLAGLVLAGHAGLPAVKELLPALARGEASVAVPLGPGPVLGAGATTHLLLPVRDGGWVLLDADHPGVELTPRTPVDFSRPLADVRLDGAALPQDRLIPAGDQAVRDVAALLGAAEASGVATWCLRTASGYAAVRRQFGRPIGSFQAVKHLCAGMLCRAEQAAATAWDAACAYDTAPDEFPLAAAVAAAVALEAAVDNAKDCVQVLGGIGFTWEHDAHLYLRRALALRALLGDGAAWRERAATLALRGARRTLPAAVPAQPRPDPELAGIAAWAVPTILRHGTPAQHDRFVAPSRRGDITWCQLFSEPEAGSDLASLRTRAVRDGGGWRLSGQKVWTSLAASADWGICLARSDPEAARHRGLTYFLVDMRAAGIDIRPLREMTGRSVFNEVFLDEVYVPDDCVLGAPGDGWRVARGTLASERVAMGRGSSLGDDVEALIGAVRAAGPDQDHRVRDRIGALVAGGLAVSLLDLRRALAGADVPGSAAVAKLVGVAQRQAVAETALSLCGAEGSTVDGAAAEPVHQFLLTRCLSIAGGTTQILLTVVGEQALGLPREGG
jgi:alkylation response protein AidB-like acyl-CoA dehydrogenase